MAIYYIDDTFFQNSEFSRQMRYKLEVLLKEREVSALLISSSKAKSDEINRFKERFNDFQIEFIESTKKVVLNDKSLLLTNNMLRLPNQDIRCFSGTVCVIDEVSLEWKRIYLDIFPNAETDIMTLLTEAIEEHIGLDDKMKLKS